MATVTLKGNSFQTAGELPEVGSKVPEFSLTATDLSDKSLGDFSGKRLVFNIFPSLDTGTCAASVRRFNTEAAALGDDVAILCISRDLPFAQSRFCGAEGTQKVVTLSAMKNNEFGKAFGVGIVSGPLEGLLSRSVVVTDANGVVKYREQVGETTEEPNYEAALAAL